MPDDGYTHVGSSRGGALRFDGLDTDASYEVKVVPRTKIGARGDVKQGATTSVMARGQDQQPSNVTGFAAEYHDGWVTMRWDCSSDRDIKGYQIRRVDGSTGNWLGGLVVAECVDTTWYAMPADYIGTTQYAIKAINTTGLQSDNPATSSVTIPSADFTMVTSQTEETGWLGTKTDTTVSSNELVLNSATSGTYETSAMSLGSLDYHQLMLSLDTDINPPSVTGAMLALRGTRPYFDRVTGTDLQGADAFEGAENLDLWAGEDWLIPGNHFYADLQTGKAVYRFWENISITVEYAYSTNSGSTFSSWIPWGPTVRQMDAVKFRVTMAVPSTDFNLALESMTAYAVKPFSLAPPDLDDLGNITITSKANWDLVWWNGSAWVNASPATVAGQIDFEDHRDTDPATKQEGSLLYWDATTGKWKDTAGNVKYDDTSGTLVFAADGTGDEAARVSQLESTANGKGASLIGLEDAGAHTGETDAEAAIAELYETIGYHGHFRVFHATAAGSSRTGWFDTTDHLARVQIPSGKKIVVTKVQARLRTGTTAGTYTVNAVMKNITDTTLVTLGSNTASASSTLEINDMTGTLTSPLGSISGPKAVEFGWENDATSPGALANNGHAIHVWFCIVDT